MTQSKHSIRHAPETQNNENLRVVIRVRPPMAREIKDGKFISTVQVAPKNDRICIFDYHSIEIVPDDQLQEYVQNPANYTMHQFAFDFIYDQESTQQEVYDTTAKFSVDSTLQGYNSTIIAYGQTGTGKTYTMHGFAFSASSPSIGIVPRSLHSIFSHIESQSSVQTTFMVRASYLQIYNESISDLLRPDHQQLHIREDKKRGVFVENLSEWAVRGPAEIYQLMRRGNSRRATASTKMNEVSSRSHAVFIITVEQIETSPGNNNPESYKSVKVGKLNLVDLAGSERVRVTGATGQRLEESKKINQSLSALGNVIAALTELKSPKAHIPYRDSKITRLLEDSLGGNCKTTFMAMISPAIDAFGESLSTLKFANRAKNIKNTPTVNQDQDQGAMIRKYQTEINRLKLELEQRVGAGLNHDQIEELQKVREKAEEDKREVMAAYEQRSREFFKEREDRKRLEEKINALESQVLVGGHKMEDTPQFQNALAEQQRIIRLQYNERLQELEKERQQIEEDKAQTDSYKQLLLKQRDIMIALTTRLNERDETILQLQEELDAYDKIQREMEDIIQNKSHLCESMEGLLRQNDIPLPQEYPREQFTKQERQPTLFLAQYPSSKMLLISDPSSNSYIQTLPMQTGPQKQSETVTHVELQNQLQINQQLQDDLKKFQQAQRKHDEDLSKLLKQLTEKDNESQRYKNEHQRSTQLVSSVKASIHKIVNQLQRPNDPGQLQNLAQELLGLQKLMNDLNPSPPKKEEPVLSSTVSANVLPKHKAKIHHASLVPTSSMQALTKQISTPQQYHRDQLNLLMKPQTNKSLSQLHGLYTKMQRKPEELFPTEP